ncbi:MAG: HAD family hydrolase [Gemmatimonadota bacterium]
MRRQRALGPLRAVIWDYDGTLVDTRRRNRSATRRILERITGRSPAAFPGVRTQRAYDELNRAAPNWRALYRDAFGLAESQIDEAGRLWSEVQATDDTPARIFAGIRETVDDLCRLPQGIVSQNGRAIIERSLRQEGLLHRFQSIVGYEEVPFQRQKPDPLGLLLTIERLTTEPCGTVAYVGDHETDAVSAARANEELARGGSGLRVVAIGAFFLGADDEAWAVRPDRRARSPREVTRIVRELMA